MLLKQESSTGRRGYPPEFRRRAVDLVDSGRRVADVARDLGVTEQSVYTWRRQGRIDRQSTCSAGGDPGAQRGSDGTEMPTSLPSAGACVART